MEIIDPMVCPEHDPSNAWITITTLLSCPFEMYSMEAKHNMGCSSRSRVTASLLLSFLTITPLTSAIQLPLQSPQQQVAPASNEHTFTLRHIFHRGLYRDPKLHKRLDVKPHHQFVTTYDDEPSEDALPPQLTVKSSALQIERLADRRHEQIEEHLEYSSFTGMSRVLGSEHWTMDELPGPNTTDKESVINLAIMAANAYVPIYGEGEWEDVSMGYNLSTDFGWQGDGLRGHIFADEGNKTIVVALKGTSPAVFDGDGTTTGDKINDNLFFSCCCGQGGQFFWRQACDCYTSTYTCNSTCLHRALFEKTRYYLAALDLYRNVTDLYPDSNTWIVGHSLGGAVSAMIGLTYGIPVVTFEAPGDDLPARRLGLPVPSHANHRHPFQQNRTGAVHFGHTADPIYMGVCNGVTSPCTLGGYAMESQCHTGTQCTYDTVGDKGWRVGLGYHRIHDVIDNVIRKYDTVPECKPDSECYDCFNWKYFESNGSDSKTSTTMSSTTTTTRTRTTTCKTPGWWGCLDESTTASTPIVTTTYTTTSCAKPGWFGCNKEVNVTVTTTTALPTTKSSSTATVTPTSASTTCKTPGWFGCEDESTTSSSSTKTTSHTATKTGKTTACETPGLFFGCWDEPTSHTTHSTATITPPPSMTSASSSAAATTTGKGHKHKKKCKHPALFGLICLD